MKQFTISMHFALCLSAFTTINSAHPDSRNNPLSLPPVAETPTQPSFPRHFSAELRAMLATPIELTTEELRSKKALSLIRYNTPYTAVSDDNTYVVSSHDFPPDYKTRVYIIKRHNPTVLYSKAFEQFSSAQRWVIEELMPFECCSCCNIQ